jgi:Right handed beta helix region
MISPDDNLPQIVSANPEGTTFCFNPGTYRMTTYMLPKNNDVFLGLSLAADLIGSQLVTSWTQSGNYWVAANQPQIIAQTADVCADSTSTACQFADAVFLDNNPLNRVMSLAEVMPGTFYRDYGSKQIYIADNPTGHSLEAVVCSRPFLAYGTGVDGVTIQGLTIEKFAGDTSGAVQGRPTWTIQGNEVRLNHGDGIAASGTILGNYSHDNGDFGLEGGFASTAMNVQDNELAFNNWANFHNGGGAKFEYATNLVVRNNYAHDNYGPGFHTDGDSANVLYEYNHTRNNVNAGLQHEISWDAVIRYNLFEDETVANPTSGSGSLWDHSSIAILNSSNVQIYGNTFMGDTNGIAGILDIRGTSTHGPHTGQTYLLQNLDVHDNSFSTLTNSTAGIVKAASFDNSVYTSWNNHFTSDTYSLPDLNGLYFAWLDISGKNAYATYSWGQWQNFGNDTGGVFQVASADTSQATTSSHTP